MKKLARKRGFWERPSIVAVFVVVPVLILMGCDRSTNNDVTAEAGRSALDAAISNAQTLLDNTVISIDGANVPVSEYWAQGSTIETFTAAIAAAEAVYQDINASQSNADEALQTLASAQGTFMAARAQGAFAGELEAGISLSPAGSHNFGVFPTLPSEQLPGDITAHEVTIRNTGRQPTGVLQVALSGIDNFAFTPSTWTLDSIPAGEQATFSVQPNSFAFGTAGSRTATVTVSGSWDSGIAPRSFDVSHTVIVEVTGISGLPHEVTRGSLLPLTGTVVPADAVNQAITWSVLDAGGTGAAISGSYLNATADGTVAVRAVIANGLADGNFTHDFYITVFSWRYVSAGWEHTMAIRNDGTLWAWGNSQNGRTGGAGGAGGANPVQISHYAWRSVFAANTHTMAIREDGTLWATGSNVVGQTGLGLTAGNTAALTQVGVERWRYVSPSSVAVNGHTMAIREDGTLWGWGNNGDGENGTGAARAAPTQVGTDNNWRSVSTGRSHTMAIRNDGTLWGWGSNTNSENGTGAGRAAPAQVGTDNNWQSVSAGSSYTMAIRNDGTLWAWGSNAGGKTGLGPTTGNTAAPTQVGVERWRYVSAVVSADANRHTVAIRNDGTLWAWGSNAGGRTGLGISAGNTGNPAQIGADNDWRSISAGAVHTMAIREGGTLWTWGSNAGGRTGLGVSTGNTGTPTHVGR